MAVTAVIKEVSVVNILESSTIKITTKDVIRTGKNTILVESAS
jgi:hypothetical protein